MATTAVRGQRLANTLARMADRLEGKFRNAFLRSMISMADDPELKKLLKDIQAGKFTYGDSIDARLNAVKFDIAEMNEIARQAIAGSAKVTKDVMNLKGSFDVVNDAVIDAARNLSIELSTNLRKSTKESLRQIVEDLIGGNISEAEALRRIQLEVGLLPQHAKAVSNYRRTLINSGTPRGKANQLAEQYAKRLLKYRANMISRTEVARATGVGQTQFWRQMRDQDALPPQANRVWITAIDERACPFCSSMNGQVASIDGGWETEKGYMEYPQGSHPHCRCSSGITMRKMTKTGKEGAIGKVEEIEWTHWVSKHLGGGHDQSTHAGGNGKINWDSLYGDGIGGYMPDVREELEGYLSQGATSSLEDWVMDSKWPKKYFKEIRDEENPDHYDVLQSRLVEAGFPDTVTITRRGTPNAQGDVRNGSAIEGWSGGSESGAHYGMDTKVYESKVPRKNIIGVGSLEEGEFFYINDGSVTTVLKKHLQGKHDQASHASKKRSTSVSSEEETFGDESQVFAGSARIQKSLSAEEIEAVSDYTARGYVEINNRLRSTKSSEELTGAQRFSRSVIDEKIAVLDGVFQKSAVASKRDMFLHRGMTLLVKKKEFSKSWVAQLKTGDVLEDKAFVSSSSEKGTAQSFATSGTSLGVIFTIRVPKGTKVMAGLDSEDELILNRGTKTRVVSVTQIARDSTDQRHSVEVELEVVP
jgi:SPP1 gp7 family putative phage head morphogenesis protein